MLKDFFNRIYQDNLDADAIIKAVQPELDKLSDGFLDIFHDNFITLATATGIAKWETVLEIIADPVNEDLTFRRERVLNRLISGIPFTERALQRTMDNIMGEGNWSYELDYRNYHLLISSLQAGRNWLAEMEATLKQIIPANLFYEFDFFGVVWQVVLEKWDTWGNIYSGGAVFNSHEDLSNYTHAKLSAYTHRNLTYRSEGTGDRTWLEVMEGV